MVSWCRGEGEGEGEGHVVRICKKSVRCFVIVVRVYVSMSLYRFLFLIITFWIWISINLHASVAALCCAEVCGTWVWFTPRRPPSEFALLHSKRQRNRPCLSWTRSCRKTWLRCVHLGNLQQRILRRRLWWVRLIFVWLLEFSPSSSHTHEGHAKHSWRRYTSSRLPRRFEMIQCVAWAIRRERVVFLFVGRAGRAGRTFLSSFLFIVFLHLIYCC